MLVPVKYTASFYTKWLQDNMDAAQNIRDSSIPIIGVDVDEKIGVLTIYMTDENSEKYVQKIDDLIDVPFDILSETHSRELQCLKTYKDIREISRTHGSSTSEWHIIKHQKYSVDAYVGLKCPDFSDLESLKKNLQRYSIVTIPQHASVEGGQHLNPQELTVVLGINNTVTWINEDDIAHGLSGNKGKTLQEMIHELGVSKVSTLKWLQSLEKDGLVYRTSLIKAGQKGRPQNVYHPTKNLKVFSDKESSNVVVIDFSKLKIICRYEKGGMCKALLPKLQRCESSICPYLK